MLNLPPFDKFCEDQLNNLFFSIQNFDIELKKLLKDSFKNAYLNAQLKIPSNRSPLPSVSNGFNYTNKSNNWENIRKAVIIRDSYRCQRCGIRLELETAHVHHIKPRVEGGDNSFENLVTLCYDCHYLMGKYHSHMKERVKFVISARKRIHTLYCPMHKKSVKKTIVFETYEYLIKKGYTPCKICKPQRVQEEKKERISFKALGLCDEIIESLWNNLKK
ncbi:HNH endonuclease [Candidatus Sumerlaeota bacterium]|nr:HNH endonuclease [Candidatus Sumerlaeota bacterium]